MPLLTMGTTHHNSGSRSLHQSLSQHSTDLHATQRARSAAPSRNVSSTSLSVMAKTRDKEREFWMPEYLEGTAYGVCISAWKSQIDASSPSPHPSNGSFGLGGIPMRREHSATVPASRNHSPHHPHVPILSRGVVFDCADKSTASPNEPPPLPSRLNDRDRFPMLELLNDGMEAKFVGPAKGTDSDAASVRADHPIPPSCGIYYYEFTVISKGNQGFFHYLYN
jgi:hypothetical protein